MNATVLLPPIVADWLNRFFGTNDDLEEEVEPRQFATWLPYRSWDEETGLFILGSQIGFCLELAPQSGADQSMADILQGMLHGWPVGTGLQIHLFGTPRIHPRLIKYASQRVADPDIQERTGEAGRPARNENIFRRLARRRVEHLAQGAHQSLTRGHTYMLRDFRLVVSVTAPIRHDEHARIGEFLNARAGLETTLRGAGFPARIWNAEDLVNWCVDFCNPHRLHRNLPAYNYDEGRLLNAHMVDGDTIQTESYAGLRFVNRRYGEEAVVMRAYTVKSYPREFSLTRMGALIGDLSQAALQYPCPFLITLGVFFTDPAGVKARVMMNQARATQNATSRMAPFMPDAADKKADWDEALRVVESGGGLVRAYHSLLLFPTEGDAVEAENAATAIWRDQGFELSLMHYIQRTILLASLPMSLNTDMHKLLTRFRVPSTKSYDNAVALAPMLAEWGGTPTPTLIGAGRRGQLMTLDFYDNTSGYGVALVGAIGSGKSVWLQEIAWSYLGAGAKVWQLDIGRSAERLTELTGGQFLDIKEGSGICVNPFWHVVSIADDMNMLQDMVAKMASPFADLEAFQYQAIGVVIKRLWDRKGRETTVTDIRDWFASGRVEDDDPEDIRLRDLATMLSPFARGGAYAEFFDGPSNIDFEGDHIVIELESLSRTPNLHRVVMLSMLFRVTSQMYFTRDRKKVFIIDELKQQLGSEGDATLTRIIESMALRARKYGGALITATQMVEHYYASDALHAAFAMADFLIVLGQRRESIEKLAQEGKLHLDEYRKRLIGGLRKEPGVFSEAFIHCPMGEGVMRLILDPHTLLTFSNRFEDNGPLDELRAQGHSLDDAIDILLARRGGRAA